jgi:hypothetical protein
MRPVPGALDLDRRGGADDRDVLHAADDARRDVGVQQRRVNQVGLHAAHVLRQTLERQEVTRIFRVAGKRRQPGRCQLAAERPARGKATGVHLDPRGRQPARQPHQAQRRAAALEVGHQQRHAHQAGSLWRAPPPASWQA